jgi:hypothetical protein
MHFESPRVWELELLRGHFILLGEEECRSIKTSVRNCQARQQQRPGLSEHSDTSSPVGQQVQHGPGRSESCSVGDVVQHHVSSGSKDQSETCARQFGGLDCVLCVREGSQHWVSMMASNWGLGGSIVWFFFWYSHRPDIIQAG